MINMSDFRKSIIRTSYSPKYNLNLSENTAEIPLRLCSSQATQIEDSYDLLYFYQSPDVQQQAAERQVNGDPLADDDLDRMWQQTDLPCTCTPRPMSTSTLQQTDIELVWRCRRYARQAMFSMFLQTTEGKIVQSSMNVEIMKKKNDSKGKLSKVDNSLKPHNKALKQKSQLARIKLIIRNRNPKLRKIILYGLHRQ